mmetsp:Transcript_118428/g.334818  ORF Transcript_118428/g.334818 Transcript_118428/m.334818 type:complete len:617 (-) Transcript_118428:131-1981(-)
MKAELMKSRRRLAHTQAVATTLRDRAEWLQERLPHIALPENLQHLPTEEEAADEARDLLQLHQRWEKDVSQLQAELLAAAGPGVSSTAGVSVASAGSASNDAAQAAELQAAQKRVRELEAEVQRCSANAAQQVSPAPVQAAGGNDPAMQAAAQKELEAAQKETKDTMKKLKQLATAYKQVDQKKNELEASLAETQKALQAASAPKVPERKQLPPELVGRVRSALSSQRQQVAELRSSVHAEVQKLPAALEEVLRSKVQELQQLAEAGSKEWKEKYMAECDKRRKLHNLVQELKGNIRVYCRCRPLNERESGSCISFPSAGEVQIYNEANATKKTWSFNEVYDMKTTQAMLFTGIRDLVVSMIDGYNVCIFAYGQTGSGKTHSMQGSPQDRGIYWRTFSELFKVAKERKGWKVDLKGALVEIYNEEIRDLLLDPSEKQRPKLQVKQSKEGGNHVPNLTLQALSSAEEVEAMLETGQKNRTVAATDMNLHSSRSHLLVQILGHMTTSEGKTISSVITLVDLAGSERIAKSGVSGDRAKEAIAINKSLAALGDVINARASKSAHTPFRNSTLTHMLQDSLSGDSKTLMLLQINPCAAHVEETTCSLQFGARVNAVEMKK